MYSLSKSSENNSSPFANTQECFGVVTMSLRLIPNVCEFGFHQFCVLKNAEAEKLLTAFTK